jgi:hypothetical protein
MGGSTTNTDGRSDSYNATAAHDTGLYDPARHDNQIVAVFESRARADEARAALLAAGIPDGAVQVLDRTAGDLASGASQAEDRGGSSSPGQGFWDVLTSLFAPDADYRAYQGAIGDGHAMVLVTPAPGMDRQQVIEVLRRSEPVDFDAKLEQWRQAGYGDTGAPRSDERARVGQREAQSTGPIRSYVIDRRAADE